MAAGGHLSATGRPGSQCNHGWVPARRQDLLRVCQQYERDPSPVTRHDPGLGARDAQPASGEPHLASCAGKEAAELYRIQTEDAWGRWLWLVAELVPTGNPQLETLKPSSWTLSVNPENTLEIERNLTFGRGRRADPGLAPAGQDSRVVGAIALMFHDRRVALAKMRALRPPLSAASLDYSLWLARHPPEGLEATRAAFLWWTAVHHKLRRCGTLP